jgi:hypothetical protein
MQHHEFEKTEVLVSQSKIRRYPKLAVLTGGLQLVGHCTLISVLATSTSINAYSVSERDDPGSIFVLSTRTVGVFSL